MLRHMALLIMVVMLALPASSSETNLPPVGFSEPELLAGVAPCYCVDIRQCPVAMQVLRQASASFVPSLTDLSSLRQNTCGFHGFVPFVCCPLESSLESRINLVPNTIMYGNPGNVHKKSYSSVYFADGYLNDSPGNQYSFMPKVHQFPRSESRIPSGPLPIERRPSFHDGSLSYEDDQGTGDYSDLMFGSHFANHPPNVHTSEQRPIHISRGNRRSEPGFPQIPASSASGAWNPRDHVFDNSGEYHGQIPEKWKPKGHIPTDSAVPPGRTWRPGQYPPGPGVPDIEAGSSGHTSESSKHEDTASTPDPQSSHKVVHDGPQDIERCATESPNPADVSVHSRGGPIAFKRSYIPCGEPKTEVAETSTPSTEKKDDRDVRQEILAASRSPGVRLLPEDQCGVTVDERIVGGKEAELGAFPWIARIGYTRNGTINAERFLYRCGGSLLNERYVLTAAHCVTSLPGGLELATVRLGELDERTNPDCRTPSRTSCADPVQDFKPEKVTVHPEYDNPRYRNDVALIRLDRPVRLSTYVSPICLPLGELALKNYTGLKATVAGWGATNLGLVSSSPVLQWIRLGLVSTDECKRSYDRADVRLDAWEQLCAGGELLADSCEGDSGGPLMRPEQPDADSLPRYFLIGVVSFGAKNCGTESMPGVYSRVSAYLGWILNTLEP